MDNVKRLLNSKKHDLQHTLKNKPKDYRHRDDFNNYINEINKALLILSSVSSTFVCEHPKRQRDYYSAVTYKCWKCKKIVVAN